MFRVARGQLTGANDGLGLKDPQGEAIYLKFMAAAYPAIENAKAQGKTPAQIFTPGSPDYVGNLANGMKRPPAQFYADMHTANGETNAATDTATNAYKQEYSRADIEAEMQRRGLLKTSKPMLPPAAVDTGPQAPH